VCGVTNLNEKLKLAHFGLVYSIAAPATETMGMWISRRVEVWGLSSFLVLSEGIDPEQRRLIAISEARFWLLVCGDLWGVQSLCKA